jgi:NADH:ubiquinone oxidoreductase subunit 4 (subunit M)
MHLLFCYTILDFELFIEFLWLFLPAHCWISSLSFILVDILTRRYHSRNLEQLYGILSDTDFIVKIIYLIVFIWGSIPGTLIFTLEFLIQINSTASVYNLIFIFLLQSLLVIFSKNTWWVLFGSTANFEHKQMSFTFTKHELFIIIFLLIQLLPILLFFDLFLL